MRESAVVKIPEFPGTRNRDKGKLFRLTEWDADKAERWGMRMMLAGNKSSGQLPLNLSGIGMEGIAILGINTFLRADIVPETLVPLLDELLECVQYVADPAKPDVLSKLLPGDIQEVATRMWLRGEVLSLHLNFSVGAALSALYRKIMIPEPAEKPSRRRTSPPA
jgi:hypothetical protein